MEMLHQDEDRSRGKKKAKGQAGYRGVITVFPASGGKNDVTSVGKACLGKEAGNY